MRLLSHLFENNRRWAAAQVASDPDFFNDLCAIQRPDYLWIGCSDSRVPANQIVGLPPGELFVHRNVANVVHDGDVNCLSVLQFAVDSLRISHVIVCGHYGCGGVQAALGPRVPMPLEQWLTPIRGVATEHRTHLDTLEGAARTSRLCELNVMAQVRALTRLATIRDAWGRGQALAVHGWIYDLRNGLLRDLEVTTDTLPAGGGMMDDLQRAPGIGPSLAEDLRALGVRSLADLRRRDPERLYERLNRLRGVRQDPCVLYAFRCAAYFTRTARPRPHLLKWWNWKGRTLGAALLLTAAAGCAAPPVPTDPMADTVRAAFVHAWSAYERYAWGHDEVRPLSKAPRDWHAASLLMTPVDAYDTMLLMGLDNSAARAKDLILERLSFDHDFEVQVFEVTIRLLGGLLTAYQMDGDERFLALARDLGDRLMPAFGSATGMPWRYVHLRTGALRDSLNNPAEIGTLMLEFGTLSKLTGDPRYYDAAKRATVALFDRRSPIGLVGTSIDVETGEWRDRTSHMTGRIDSYYEYLLKSWELFDDADFARMWRESIAAANRYLPDEQPTGWWYGHVDMDTGRRLATRFGALDAFLPAVLALGSDLSRADRLMTSVYSMWTTFGIEPEQLDYVTMEPVSPGYVLRPEAIESAYYLYRLTGDMRYREMGRSMIDSVLHHTRADAGYASLRSVVTREQADRMESFFLAETLKYAYLLFAPPSTLDLQRVVFNTEAHPLWPTWE